MAFFISPMGSFQRGMQILNNWYGGQLDASLDSGSGTKSPLNTVLEGFAYPCETGYADAYPCETGYADFVRVYGTADLNIISISHSLPTYIY